MGYKHIFFDLDRTLWDFESNSYETLLELCSGYKLNNKGIADYDEFINNYKFHNEELWNLYRINKISQQDLRRERFQRALADFGIDNYILAKNIGEDYIKFCPRKNKLFPYVFEVLDYLKDRYTLHIITNGFEKTQHIKLENANLAIYFKHVITSENLGFKKPNPSIFSYALDLAAAKKEESIYIGDNLVVDILGCQNFGIDGIYFNPDKKEHNENVAFEISSLREIMEIL